jgi:polysaccharide biosynthesis protein PslF
MRICHVSTFPPTLCGIAMFAKDLSTHIPARDQSICTIVYGNTASNSDQLLIRINEWKDYVQAADHINRLNFDAVVVQHEFGIFGGSDGEYVVPFLQMLSMPIVIVLHSVPDTLSSNRKRILATIALASEKIIVLSDTAKRNLLRISNVDCRDIEMIPHGVPSVDFRYPASMALRKRMQSEIVFMSFGFMKPKKGIENSLYTFAQFLKSVPTARLLLVGGQQPQFEKCDGYVDTLRDVIRMLEIGSNVLLIGKSLSNATVFDYVSAADFGLLNYQDYEQVSSGVLPFILACGRPVISTRFAYARECADRCDGVILTEASSPDCLLDTMHLVWNNRGAIHDLMERTYRQTRGWIWSSVAGRFYNIISEAIQNAGINLSYRHRERLPQRGERISQFVGAKRRRMAGSA